MAACQVKSDFSGLCFDDKSRISGVIECKYCTNMKQELKELQYELSSAKLIIKLLHSESNSSECAGYRTIEPRNLIQCRYVDANKAKEDKWIEVIPGHRRRTKQIATSKELRKRQVETESRYHVLQNLQEMNGVVEGLELKRIEV